MSYPGKGEIPYIYYIYRIPLSLAATGKTIPPPAPAGNEFVEGNTPGNYLHPVNFIESYSYLQHIYTCDIFILKMVK